MDAGRCGLWFLLGSRWTFNLEDPPLRFRMKTISRKERSAWEERGLAENLGATSVQDWPLLKETWTTLQNIKNQWGWSQTSWAFRRALQEPHPVVGRYANLMEANREAVKAAITPSQQLVVHDMTERTIKQLLWRKQYYMQWRRISQYRGLTLHVGKTALVHESTYWEVKIKRASYQYQDTTMLGITRIPAEQGPLSLAKLVYLHRGECFDYAQRVTDNRTDVHVTLLPHGGAFLCILSGGGPDREITVGLGYDKTEGQLSWYVNGIKKGILIRELHVWEGDFRPFIGTFAPRDISMLRLRRNPQVNTLVSLCRAMIRKRLYKIARAPSQRLISASLQQTLLNHMYNGVGEMVNGIDKLNLPIPLKEYLDDGIHPQMKWLHQ